MSLLTQDQSESNHKKIFQEYSVLVGYHVDLISEEIKKIIVSSSNKGNKGSVPLSLGNNNTKGREQIGNWGISKIMYLVNGMTQTPSKYLFDLFSKDSLIEVKTCQKSKNGCVIREKQLVDFSNIITKQKNKYYALVYYKTKNDQKIKDISKEKLESNLIPSVIYILPIEYIRFHYNTHGSKKISQKEGLFKKIHMGPAEKLFNIDTGDLYEKKIFQLWGIDIKIINYNGHNFNINKKATEKIKKEV